MKKETIFKIIDTHTHRLIMNELEATLNLEDVKDCRKVFSSQGTPFFVDRVDKRYRDLKKRVSEAIDYYCPSNGEPKQEISDLFGGGEIIVPKNYFFKLITEYIEKHSQGNFYFPHEKMYFHDNTPSSLLIEVHKELFKPIRYDITVFLGDYPNSTIIEGVYYDDTTFTTHRTFTSSGSIKSISTPQLDYKNNFMQMHLLEGKNHLIITHERIFLTAQEQVALKEQGFYDPVEK